MQQLSYSSRCFHRISNDRELNSNRLRRPRWYRSRCSSSGEPSVCKHDRHSNNICLIQDSAVTSRRRDYKCNNTAAQTWLLSSTFRACAPAVRVARSAATKLVSNWSQKRIESGWRSMHYMFLQPLNISLPFMCKNNIWGGFVLGPYTSPLCTSHLQHCGMFPDLSWVSQMFKVGMVKYTTVYSCAHV